jgi:DNA-directed RNA polymerase specialized sigma24 family protein
VARHYLDNSEFEAAIKAKDRDAVARCLLTLADHIVNSRVAIFPPTLDADDVKQVVVMDALRRLPGWEKARGSAFSYFTGSALFSIMAEVKKERAWSERHTPLVIGIDEEAGL